MPIRYSTFIKSAAFLGLVVHSILPAQRTLEKLTGIEFYNDHAIRYSSRFSIGYEVFNLVVLILAFRYASQIDAWTESYVRFAAGENRRRRRLIQGLLALLVLIYCGKIHFGFFHHGIAGWVYPDREYIFKEPQLNGSTDFPSDLKSGLLPENVRYIPRAGYFTRKLMMLEFNDGSRRPTNYGVTSLVFDYILFGNEYEEIEQPQLFWKIYEWGYENHRRGRRFILPISIAYPNHAPYMSINYRDYPDVSQIRAITLWKLEVFADPKEGILRPVSAEKLAEVLRE
jgi:hypothetical protein